jgi:hypothetical protein
MTTTTLDISKLHLSLDEVLALVRTKGLPCCSPKAVFLRRQRQAVSL